MYYKNKNNKCSIYNFKTKYLQSLKHHTDIHKYNKIHNIHNKKNNKFICN